jgi:hypothetical protein
MKKYEAGKILPRSHHSYGDQFLLQKKPQCLLSISLPAQTTYFVKAGSAGNGSSWSNASGDLQAINKASLEDNIFVAAGTYQPPVNSSFIMKQGVKIYGGFAGMETSLSQRNLSAGDTSKLKRNGSRVVRNDFNHLDSTAILDGFTITDGSGVKNLNPTTTYGGGILNYYSAPAITNCVFANNSASYGGG